MTVARTVRRFSALSLPAALALGALLSAPASAAAQFTLTFDASTNPCMTSGSPPPCSVVNNYGTMSGIVTIKDGTLPTFGSTAGVSGADLQDTTGSGANSVNETAANGNVAEIPLGTACLSTPSCGVGAFDFQLKGGKANDFFELDSLRIGNSSSSALSGEVEVYALNGTELYTSNPITIAANSTQLLTPDALFGGPLAANKGEFIVEFGAVNSLNSSSFTVDNLTFDVEAVAPEPGTLALFGTGLLGLAPMMLRRRRRRSV